MNKKSLVMFVLSIVMLGFAQNSKANPSRVQFPAHFQWGVSTSAHQIEGQNTNSDWWVWEQAGNIKNNEISGLATDHWNRVEEDILLIKKLNVKYYRMSIEWAKVEPREGVFDQTAIDHYRQETKLLLAYGIQPLITLHHFTFPIWVSEKGGWKWDGIVSALSGFTKVVYSEIAPEVKYWNTINEPMVEILSGYFTGVWPPGQKLSIPELVPIVVNCLKAHAKMYQELHHLAFVRGQVIQVGMAHALRVMQPYNPWSLADQAVTHIADDLWNWMMPDAIATGRLTAKIFGIINHTQVIQGLKGTQDFVGLNYYTSDLIQFSLTEKLVMKTNPQLPKSDLGWDIFPQGLFQVLLQLHQRYPLQPIVITENGIADASDQKRSQYLRDHLLVISQAIRQGIPIQGYYHWSLLDNFEWAEGFGPRFGLYHVNYQTFARTPRASAFDFSKIVKNNGF